MICWDDNLLGGKEGQRKFPLVQYESLFWYPYKMTQLKPAYVTKLPWTNIAPFISYSEKDIQRLWQIDKK